MQDLSIIVNEVDLSSMLEHFTLYKRRAQMLTGVDLTGGFTGTILTAYGAYEYTPERLAEFEELIKQAFDGEFIEVEVAMNKVKVFTLKGSLMEAKAESPLDNLIFTFVEIKASTITV